MLRQSLGCVGVGIAIVVAACARSRPPSDAESGAASASASTPASASASAPASAPAPAPAANVTSTTGVLHTAGAPKGHRVYVDGVVAGQTPEDLSVRCGVHNVKTSGKTWRVSVPCGGETGIFQ